MVVRGRLKTGGGEKRRPAGPAERKRGTRQKQREQTRASRKGKETRKKRGLLRRAKAARPVGSEAQGEAGEAGSTG